MKLVLLRSIDQTGYDRQAKTQTHLKTYLQKHESNGITLRQSRSQ